MKKIYDLTIEQLKRKSSIHYSLYVSYLIVGLIVGVVMGFYGLQSIDGVMNSQDTLGDNFLILFNLVLSSIIFLFIGMIFLILEKSHNRTQQLFCDLMIYLKEKEMKLR